MSRLGVASRAIMFAAISVFALGGRFAGAQTTQPPTPLVIKIGFMFASGSTGGSDTLAGFLTAAKVSEWPIGGRYASNHW